MRRVILSIISIAIAITAILFLLTPLYANASIENDIPLAVVDADEAAWLWDYYSLQEDDQISSDETILSFDISEHREIALITSKHHLLYMDLDGTINASFSFYCTGSVGVMWDRDEICLLFTRSSIVMKVDKAGALKGMFRMSDINYATQAKWNSLGFRTQKEVGSRTYMLSQENGLFRAIQGEAYTQLVFRDSQTGDEQVVYNVRQMTTWSIAVKIILAIMFIAVVVVVVRHRKGMKNNTGDG